MDGRHTIYDKVPAAPALARRIDKIMSYARITKRHEQNRPLTSDRCLSIDRPRRVKRELLYAAYRCGDLS